MKDRVFSGRDVAAAVTSAAQALGVPSERLRYVVLAREQAGGLGLSPMPARIAVMADAPMGSVAAAVDVPAAREDGTLALIEALARALGQELQAEFQESRGRRHVWLKGRGCGALIDADGHTLRALEHLLGRMGAGEETGLRLECAGFREFRDGWLCAQARELGEAVLADGLARTTSALNAYERRLIHKTIAERPGLRTYSLGESNDRRVTVALAEEAAQRG